MASDFAFLLDVYVVVQFYTGFKFYFPLFLGTVLLFVMYDNEFKTINGNKN